MVTVYKSNRSPMSRSVLMTIEYINAKIDLKNVDPQAGETFKPEFLVKNPLHTVPVLEEGDFLITDSHSIVTYLVSKFGGDKKEELYPSDLKLRATIDQRLYYDATILWGHFKDSAIAILRNNAPEIPKETRQGIDEIYNILELYLQSSDFMALDHITLADISMVSTVSSIDIFVPIDDKHPRLLDWFNRMKGYDWYKKGNAGLAEIRGMVEAKLKR